MSIIKPRKAFGTVQEVPFGKPFHYNGVIYARLKVVNMEVHYCAQPGLPDGEHLPVVVIADDNEFNSQDDTYCIIGSLHWLRPNTAVQLVEWETPPSFILQ